MKSRQVEKKQTLKLRVEEHINFKLIGISSHENDYRLVWSINNLLKMQFVRMENLIIHRQKLKTDMEFSRFSHHNEDKYLTYFLISNRCPDGFLFPEVKNFDFLLQIIGDINDGQIKELIRDIKTASVVSAVFLLQPEKIKDITRVLPD